MRVGLADLVMSNPGLPFWPGASGMGDLADLVGSQPGYPFWPGGSGMGDLADLVGAEPGLPFWPGAYQMTGGGCGCGGTCGGCGGHGMGQLSTDFSSMVGNLTSGNFSTAWTNFTSVLSDPLVGSVPTWVFLAGGIALLWFTGKKGRRR